MTISMSVPACINSTPLLTSICNIICGCMLHSFMNVLRAVALFVSKGVPNCQSLYASKRKFHKLHQRYWCSLCTLYLFAFQVRVTIATQVFVVGLCDAFQALINSFVCRFCSSTLGLILFQHYKSQIKHSCMSCPQDHYHFVRVQHVL